MLSIRAFFSDFVWDTGLRLETASLAMCVPRMHKQPLTVLRPQNALAMAVPSVRARVAVAIQEAPGAATQEAVRKERGRPTDTQGLERGLGPARREKPCCGPDP